jgi:hypothetical protein
MKYSKEYNEKKGGGKKEERRAVSCDFVMERKSDVFVRKKRICGGGGKFWYAKNIWSLIILMHMGI